MKNLLKSLPWLALMTLALISVPRNANTASPPRSRIRIFMRRSANCGKPRASCEQPRMIFAVIARKLWKPPIGRSSSFSSRWIAHGSYCSSL